VGGREDRGLGWESIQDALTELYGDQQPQHFGTVRRYADGGDDPLDGVSAYLIDEPRHWHLVTFGLSELYEKQSADAEVSGWGFELTFRLARDHDHARGAARDTDGGGECPTWPVQFLQTLARYVFNTGAVFDEGHHIAMGGPITTSGSPALTGLVFTKDPRLPQLRTPNGSVKFIQAICVTREELNWVGHRGVEEFIDLYAARNNPLLVSDMDRQSVVGGLST
jgi:suppressor of fused-like protein